MSCVLNRIIEFIKLFTEFVNKIYYCAMLTISAITLIIAIIKLFPKIKCYCKFVDNNSQNEIRIYFINLRQRTIVLDKIIIYYKGEDPVVYDVRDIVISSSENTNYYFSNNIDSIDGIGKIVLEDIEGHKFNVKIR